jgi:hypothetical protein
VRKEAGAAWFWVLPLYLHGDGEAENVTNLRQDSLPVSRLEPRISRTRINGVNSKSTEISGRRNIEPVVMGNGV